MNIQYILKNFVKLKENKDYTNLSKIALEFNIHDYLMAEETERITSYFFHKWLCTDTFVGYRIYFFDDVPFAVTIQPARKSGECFYFISHKMALKVKKYIISLIEPAEDVDSYYILDKKRDFGLGGKVSYYEQLLTKNVMVSIDGVYTPATIVGRSNTFDDSYNEFITVTVNNVLMKVLMSDILVPYAIAT